MLPRLHFLKQDTCSRIVVAGAAMSRDIKRNEGSNGPRYGDGSIFDGLELTPEELEEWDDGALQQQLEEKHELQERCVHCE